MTKPKGWPGQEMFPDGLGAYKVTEREFRRDGEKGVTTVHQVEGPGGRIVHAYQGDAFASSQAHNMATLLNEAYREGWNAAKNIGAR